MKKEILHYLPYEVNLIHTLTGDAWKLDITNINAITKYDKLILRPLSDLFKPIDWEDNGELTILGCKYGIEKITEGNVEIYADEYYADYAETPKCYVDITSFNWWLFEKHFDVFGLIEKGLAVDIKYIAI